MLQDYKKSYDNLSIESKRNELSNEIIVVSELITKIEQLIGLDLSNGFKVKNYNSMMNLNESDMLSFVYEDIYYIQKELLAITAKILSQKND